MLSPELIVLTAAQLLESDGWAGLSMRRLAQALDVDPMALYHHVPGKAALLAALAAHQFAGLDVAHPPFAPRAPWPRRLEALAGAYLQRIAAAPELVRSLARAPAAADAPARQFTALLRLALADLALDAATLRAAGDLLVDYLHGYALAPDAARRTGWRSGVRLIAAGLAAAAGR
jgi:AcrR family transcriptional regulator